MCVYMCVCANSSQRKRLWATKFLVRNLGIQVVTTIFFVVAIFGTIETMADSEDSDIPFIDEEIVPCPVEEKTYHRD